MTQIAIKGHPTRDKEVIEILEMLGGQNNFNLIGDASDLYYYINNDNKITYTLCNINGDFKLFTVEEFLEKYPYKVGDVVMLKGDIVDGKRFTINHMFWNGENIKYDGAGVDNPRNFYSCSACRLLPYKKETETMEETMEIKPNQIENKNAFIDIANAEYNNVNTIELLCSDMFDIEIIHEDKIVLKRKKPQYPKTYDECVNMFNCTVETVNLETLKALRELIYCRNAYWKIAGEQMGLGKPWEPDWVHCDLYCIGYNDHVITWHIQGDYNRCYNYNRLLAFPTEEMCDMFYENFKELIETCKEFL